MAVDTKLGISPDEVELPTGPVTEPKNLKYNSPEIKGVRGIVPLCKSDIALGIVQIVKTGGENNLHSHGNMDTIWFVLDGKVRFYGPGDKLYGEYAKHEGIFMPRNCQYWFEAVGDEPLELLQCGSFLHEDGASFRTDYEPKKEGAKKFEIFAEDGEVLHTTFD